MLTTKDIGYHDLDVISAYSGKGWPTRNNGLFGIQLKQSWAIVQDAIAKAKAKK